MAKKGSRSSKKSKDRKKSARHTARLLKDVKGLSEVVKLGSIIGTFEVPSGEGFTIEVAVLHDNPIWEVWLVRPGSPASEDLLIGRGEDDGDHMRKDFPPRPDGDYTFVVVATLQAPGLEFRFRAMSSTDDERVTLVFVPNHATQTDLRPMRVS